MIAPVTGFPIPCARPADSLSARAFGWPGVVPCAQECARLPRVRPFIPRVMTGTARKAGELAGNPYQFAKTPGAAWVESGLARAFPDSFDQVRALAGKMDGAEACCRDLLAQWQELLDCEALHERESDEGND